MTPWAELNSTTTFVVSRYQRVDTNLAGMTQLTCLTLLTNIVGKLFLLCLYSQISLQKYAILFAQVIMGISQNLYSVDTTIL